MSDVSRCLVRPDTYRDSVELMRVAAEMERAPGVARAALMMATPANRALLAEARLLTGDAETAGANDLVIAVTGRDAAAAEAALDRAVQMLSPKPVIAGSLSPAPPPRTLAEARARLDGANLAIVSTPGAYAAAEALKALKRGLHVFLFSDNVSLDEEIELKRVARSKSLMLMGPDCGTAILDGIPLGFANAVKRGRIGLVGASGTGLQQVSCLIDRIGEGVSQVIGVGGRDLDERVGGVMMRAAIERLADDPETRVLVLVSKPPTASVAQHILEAARNSGTPVVVSFLGADASAIEATGARPAATLEDAARLAVSIARGEPAPTAVSGDQRPAESRARIGHLASRRRRVRGLFSGGTLCLEAKLILASSECGAGHTAVDLGADELTVGRPHPMIDFRLRNDRIAATAAEPDTAVILLDVVLGYGAHPDPAGALVPAIDLARERHAEAGQGVAFVASICGTPGDPQGLESQEERLRAAGVVLAPSNAEAARLAARLALGDGELPKRAERSR
jgi:succinyl-CoA synthetase alpha subunit